MDSVIIMKVVKIITAQAIPGMIVAEDVFTKDNHLIIAKDTSLTDKLITRLTFYSIFELSVCSETDQSKAETNFVEETYYEKIKNSESFKRFQIAYLNVVDEYRESMDDLISAKKDVDTEQLISMINKILYNYSSNIEVVDMLHCMRNYDDTTYVHSINVALICNIIGKWLNFIPKDLEIITLCGLLHDVGKLLVPQDIILKPAKLTNEEFDVIKTHSIRGYNLLKAKSIDSRIKHAVLMHHERCDGSGYPFGFFSDQIDPYAKLVAIADVYDAMTSARVYRGPLCPFAVVNIFETEGFTKYDSKYIMTFLEGIIQTYIHNNVRLSDNQIGEVVLINKNELSRPILMVGGQFIDLSRQRNIHIEAMI